MVQMANHTALANQRGPKGMLLIGSLPEFAKDPLAFLQRIQREFGPLTPIRLGLSTSTFVTEPALIEELLVGKHRECVRNKVALELVPLVGWGLLTLDGDPWRKQRRLLAPPFQPKHIAAYADTMVELSQHAFSAFRDDEVRDFRSDIMALTLEVVGRTLLGFDTKADAEKVAHAMDEAIPYFEHRLFTLWGVLPASLPTPRRRRFERAKRDLDAIVAEMIERARHADDSAEHLLARLIRARDDDGQPMDEQRLADEAITMLLAGHETTALSIMFAVYMLSQHATVSDRLRAQIDEVLAGRPATMADLPKLPLLEAVIKETLRLYPAAPIIGREVAVPIDLGGHIVPRGTHIVMSPYAIHRDPRFFNAADQFVPDRWLDGSTEDLPKFAYFPFGGGPRICIGQHFAMMEAQLLLATLLQQVTFEVPASFQMKLAPVITLRSKHGLPLRVHRRPPIVVSQANGVNER